MAKRAEKVAARARKCAEKWRANFQKNINQYHEMFAFVYGEQWTDDEQEMLKSYKKIPLKVNKLATLINSLIGEQQLNTPQLQVVPLDACDYQTARIRELITKDIMFNGGAKIAYQQAAIQAFVGGFGAFAVMTDYVDPMSFDLDITYKYFKDATKCYWDVGAERVNKTDGMYCGWISRLSRKKFREIYGKDIEKRILPDDNSGITASEEEVSLATSTTSSGMVFNWADDDSVTVIDHFERKYIKDTLYKLSNGRTLDQKELEQLIDASQERLLKIQELEQIQQLQEALTPPQQPDQEQPMGEQPAPAQPIEQPAPTQPPEDDRLTLFDDGQPVTIIDKKEIKRHKIKHYKISGDYILEETDFPSDQLPLVFVDQASWYDKNGQQICRPFIIDAKDTQKYLNYLATQSAYLLKVSRYDQWIGSKRNVASSDTQQKWRDPLIVQGILTFDESDSGVIPQQVRPPELPQSLVTQYQRAIEDLYTGTGLYPTRMGQQGNEVSGAAIDARTRQGSYATFPAFNSINRAIAVGGEIVNEMIPRVYDTERVISIMSPSEGIQTFVINKQLDDYGEAIENDIRKGTYQVKLLPGPSFEGQKEQALESLNAVLQVNPQAFNMVADLYAENLPLANTIELKNRLKTLVPPDLLEIGKTGRPPEREQHQPSVEQQQLALQQQQQQFEQQMRIKQLELKQQELELEKQKQLIELQIAMEKIEGQKLEIAGKLQGEELRFVSESDRTASDNAIAHADNLVKILTHQ